MNLNSDDYYSRKQQAIINTLSLLVSDGGEQKLKGIRSPTPKGQGHQSVDHTFIRDDQVALVTEPATDGYVNDMKKGISNILVSCLVIDCVCLGCCTFAATLAEREGSRGRL